MVFILGAALVHPLRYLDQGIQTDHIAGPKGGGFGATNQRTCELIHRGNIQIQAIHAMQQGHDSKNSDAIGDKRRAVFGLDGYFAQFLPAKMKKKIHPFGIGIRTGNNFE